LGFDGVRISEELGWDNWEASLDVFNASAEAHGLFIMQTCQPIDHIMPVTSKDISDYANYVAHCFTKSRVKMVGIGNEWNGFGLKNNWDPSLAADIVMACIQACSNLGPIMKGKTLITPEVSPGHGMPLNGVWPAY